MTVIPWVQLGVCVDRLVTSVHVNPITLALSVISVPQDIMAFQTAGVSTDFLLDTYVSRITVCFMGSFYI